jgi:predicted RNA-binding Zn-ribbon protein involved in translation (DUF1610 family)
MSDIFPPENYVITTSAVPGIEVYRPAVQEPVPGQEMVDFKCPQCGGTTAFSAVNGGLTCSHCGYHEAPSQPVEGKNARAFEFTPQNLAQASQGWGERRTDMACQSCGALTTIAADSLTNTCPFCGSNQVIQRQAAQDMLRPSHVVPFAIDIPACQKIARDWLGSSWMVPETLKNLASIGAFQGLYLPYWTLDSQTRASWKAQVGHPETERYYDNGQWKTRTVIRWRWESGQTGLNIDDLLVCGTDKVSAHLMDEIKAYDLSRLAAYELSYLAGLGAKSYDIPLEKAWESGRAVMRENTRQACLHQASTPMVRNFSMELDYSNENWRYVLLPAYLTSYRYENKVYQVIVNGQTGRISGQRPADWNKIWLVIAAILAPGLLVGSFGLLTSIFGGIGIPIAIFGFILFIAGLVGSVIIHQQAQALEKI